jgi:predicted aspartyl protease
MGRGALFVSAALLGLAALSPPVRAAEGEHCKLLLATALDMQFGPGGNPVIPVSIEGQDKPMAVDTGGVYSMVTSKAATDLNLRKDVIEPGEYYMASGAMITRSATTQSFKIGRLQLKRYAFLVLPDGEMDDETSGTLAPDIMRRFDVEFDFAGKKFKVFSQDHCEGKVVYWTNDDHAALPFELNEAGQITLTAELDGRRVKVMLDTGSSISTMPLRRAQDLLGVKDDASDLKSVPDVQLKGVDQVYAYPLKSLDLGGVVVRNPNIVFYRDNLSSFGMPDILLGMTVLSKLHIYIAYKEKMLYITPADAAAPAATPP